MNFPANHAVGDRGHIAVHNDLESMFNELVVNVKRKPYNATGNGASDDFAAIDAAAGAVETAGGGTVYLPKGTYRISAHLRPRARVRYLGAGMGLTVIAPYQSAAFTGHGTLAAPIESPAWQDMTWDGSAIPAVNSLKGHFSEYLRDALWLRVECKEFTATGFGSDYLPGSRYIDCVATNNGRGQAIDGPGMSGFGIGTGQYAVEEVLVQGCRATGNTNYGIFVERQPRVGAVSSYGVRVVGNYVSGNGYGIGGCGVDGAVYADNVVRASVRDGITLHAGSGGSPLGMPDRRATITGNSIQGCGRDGIHLDYAVNSIPASNARHLIANNNVSGNARDGLRLVSSVWASDVVRGIKVIGNRFAYNTGYGVNVIKATGAEVGVTIADLGIESNDVLNNTAGAIVYPAGLLTGDSVIKGNRGYVPGWASITIGASPITYTCGVTPETVYWAGGATTTVKVTPKGSTQATVLLATGSATVTLEPGDAVEFAYSSAATSIKTLRRQ